MSTERATAEAIGALSRGQFEYGELDCCKFAAEVVLRVHGVNLLRGWDYSTKREALGYLRAFGGLRNLLSAALGSPVSPKETADGEVLLAKDEKNRHVVGVRFQNRAVFKTAGGVTSLSIDDSRLISGWRVSCLKR